ncbi:hypothetical protein BUALT_Bualt01G0228400 [Buddleja alternifolia]|uniref:Uncharacterized protein n=1 Tax=Buddleja alternifolia TaxID=168488 RepID=A0AAV6Y9E0_9LAMI|nr:hypothetical protein BUALT_Bualt01G0228400 [Buddleja alternifolia]
MTRPDRLLKATATAAAWPLIRAAGTLPTTTALTTACTRSPPPCEATTVHFSLAEEMGTSTEDDQKKKVQPQLVKLEKALKLAEQWVNNMSTTSVNQKSFIVDLEGRPSRLGIGATVPRESKVELSNDPVQRKLLAKLHADKRKTIKRDEEAAPSAKDGSVDEDSEEEESESKTRAFSKKRPMNLTSPLHAKKKHR